MEHNQYHQPNYYLNLIQQILDDDTITFNNLKRNIDLPSFVMISNIFGASNIQTRKEDKKELIKALKKVLKNSGYEATKSGLKEAIQYYYDTKEEEILDQIATLLNEVKVDEIARDQDVSSRIHTSIVASAFSWRSAIEKTKKTKPTLGDLKSELSQETSSVKENKKPVSSEKEKVELPANKPEKVEIDLPKGLALPKETDSPEEIDLSKEPSVIDYSEFKDYLSETNPNKAAIKKILRDKKTWKELVAIALDEEAPPVIKEVLIEALFERPEKDMLDFAQDPKLTGDVLTALYNRAKSFDRNWRVRMYVIAHKNVPMEIVLDAARNEDEDYRVQMAAAASPKLDNVELIQTMNQDDPRIRMELIKNPHTPADILDELYDEMRKKKSLGDEDESEAYREQAISFSQHKNLPSQKLKELLNDSAKDLGLDPSRDPERKKNPWRDPKLKSVREDSHALAIAKNIASNSDLPSSIYRQLGKSNRIELRMAIAQNKYVAKSDPKLMKWLTNDENLGVAQAARNALESIGNQS